MRGSLFSFLPLSLLLCTADGANFEVTVGKDNRLKFVPETLDVAIGDTVTYRFFSKNHAVTQSSFDEPCKIMPNGFFSGFVPTVSDTTPSKTTFTITVNDTKPIWVYCAQTNNNHCQGGMLQSINAAKSGDKTFEAYKAKAGGVPPPSNSPPDGLPVGGARVTAVEVGKDGLTFTPNNIAEPPGTIVEFNFNPANHSVVQSSFDKPCVPLEGGGFSSGFVPTTISPSGVVFSVVVPSKDPIWFYCAQNAKTHCQSGMVGSINAPTSGRTLDEFIKNAKAASSPSLLPPIAPQLGLLTVNGTIITSVGGNVLNASALDRSAISFIPLLGVNVSAVIAGMAGGTQPANYNWGPNISDNAANSLQLLQFLSTTLLSILLDAHEKLSSGPWTTTYPSSIKETISSMAAQSVVHRMSATDSLQHYSKPVLGLCEFKAPAESPEEFLKAALTVLNLEISLLLGVISASAVDDPWLVPVLATAVGAKSRMAGVVNMMQAHSAAAAPREAMLPPSLVFSYAMQKYVSTCPDSDALEKSFGKPAPELVVKGLQRGGAVGRVTGITVDLGKASGELFIAWVGAWGNLQFTPVLGDGSAAVPADLHGHVWVVMTNKQNIKLAELPGVTVAGPEMVWVSASS